jgi:hypothetical protein
MGTQIHRNVLRLSLSDRKPITQPPSPLRLVTILSVGLGNLHVSSEQFAVLFRLMGCTATSRRCKVHREGVTRFYCRRDGKDRSSTEVFYSFNCVAWDVSDCLRTLDIRTCTFTEDVVSISTRNIPANSNKDLNSTSRSSY